MIANACKCHVAYKNRKLSYRNAPCHRQRVTNDGVDAHCDKRMMVDVPLEKQQQNRPSEEFATKFQIFETLEFHYE